jgi:hypothetical protein
VDYGLRYLHSTSAGTSGAPLLLKQNHNSYEVVGMHLWGEYKRNAGILLKNISLKTQILSILPIIIPSPSQSIPS